MSKDAFWDAFDSAQQPLPSPQISRRRKKKIFQSTESLLDDIQSDNSCSASDNVPSCAPSPATMRTRFNGIKNNLIANNTNVDTSNTSSSNSTFVMINESALQSKSSSCLPSVAPIQCCDEPEIYHKYTLSGAEREAIIRFKSDGIYPDDRKTPQNKQAFKCYCNRFEMKIASLNGKSDVLITRNKIQYKRTSDNKVITAVKAKKMMDSEYDCIIHKLTVPKCCDILNIFINYHITGHVRDNTMVNQLHNVYWFKNLSKFIKWGLSQCENCARIDNSIHRNYVAPLHVLPITTQPYTGIHVDLSGPYPESDWGNNCLAIAVDRYHQRIQRLSDGGSLMMLLVDGDIVILKLLIMVENL